MPVLTPACLRKVFFKTLGCRLNQAEVGSFARLFIDGGWVVSKDAPDAVVLHSCAVTRAAERETFRYIRVLRREYPSAVLAVTGCAIACNPESLFIEAGADVVIAVKDTPRLPEILKAVLQDRENCTLHIAHCTLNDAHFPVQLPSFSTKRALLKVQDGCSFNCAYCVVPLTRGPSVSRDWDLSIDSACRLLDAGFREIVVTGCNLACYRSGKKGLPELTDALCVLAKRYGARIRLGSVEPGICDDEILSVMREHDNLCRFLHYPIQSGDPQILKKMGRLYSAEYITDVLSRIRTEFPCLGLGADFITGLPGEDEKAFERTCAMVKEFEFANVHVFPYSPRQGTRAPGFKNCPSRTTAKQRAEELRKVADEAGMSFRRRLVDRKTEVLVEGFGKDGLAYGWNGEYVQCRFSAPGAKIAEIYEFTPASVSSDGVLTLND